MPLDHLPAPEGSEHRRAEPVLRALRGRDDEDSGLELRRSDTPQLIRNAQLAEIIKPTKQLTLPV